MMHRRLTFEVGVVDHGEPNQGAEESPVGFDDAISEKVTQIREARFQFVERSEKRVGRSLVGVLPGGETGAVNAVVHFLVNKF